MTLDGHLFTTQLEDGQWLARLEWDGGGCEGRGSSEDAALRDLAERLRNAGVRPRSRRLLGPVLSGVVSFGLAGAYVGGPLGALVGMALGAAIGWRLGKTWTA